MAIFDRETVNIMARFAMTVLLGCAIVGVVPLLAFLLRRRPTSRRVTIATLERQESAFAVGSESLFDRVRIT